MASSLIRGKYVVTRAIDAGSSEIITDGAVLQQDGVILAVGSYDELRASQPVDEVIGSGQEVVLPGLINAHHHIGLTPFQLGIPDLPLELWITARGAMRPVDPYLDTLYCAIQMIESGITTVMHNHALWRIPSAGDAADVAAEVLRAYHDAGMRVAFSFSYRDQNQIVYQDDEEFLASLPADLASRLRVRLDGAALSHQEYFGLFGDLFERYGTNRSEGRVRLFLSPANVQWCSDEMLADMKSAAQRYQTGLHIHLLETVYQKLYGLRHYGTSALAHLHDLGVLGPEVSCAHGVWLTSDDIDVLAATDTCICLNASSNLRLKSGIAPLNALAQRGVGVAIGIDEAGINDDNDILMEMRLVQKLHRVPGVDSANPTSHQILAMATVAGARATYFDRVGTLEPGRRADLILVGLDHIAGPYLHPDTNIVDAIVYRGRGLDVEIVIVDGEVLMRGRRVTRVNKEEVWRELRAHLTRELTPTDLERTRLAEDLYPQVQRFYRSWPLPEGRPFYRYNDAGL